MIMKLCLRNLHIIWKKSNFLLKFSHIPICFFSNFFSFDHFWHLSSQFFFFVDFSQYFSILEPFFSIFLRYFSSSIWKEKLGFWSFVVFTLRFFSGAPGPDMVPLLCRWPFANMYFSLSAPFIAHVSLEREARTRRAKRETRWSPRL